MTSLCLQEGALITLRLGSHFLKPEPQVRLSTCHFPQENSLTGLASISRLLEEFIHHHLPPVPQRTEGPTSTPTT